MILALDSNYMWNGRKWNGKYWNTIYYRGRIPRPGYFFRWHKQTSNHSNLLQMTTLMLVPQRLPQIIYLHQVEPGYNGHWIMFMFILRFLWHFSSLLLSTGFPTFPFEAIYSHLEQFAAICSNLERFVAIWSNWEPFWAIKSNLEQLGASLSHVELFWLILRDFEWFKANCSNFEHFGGNWIYLEQFGAIWNNLEQFRAIRSHLEQFGATLESFGAI